MALFKIGKTVVKSLFGKPATGMYPVKPARSMEATRGKLAIDIEKCIFCGSCKRICPAAAIEVDRNEKTWEIDRFRCVICGRCTEVCPVKCLSMDRNYVAPTTEPASREKFKQEKAPEKPAAKKE
ncbi:MAG: 4Fe-4S dicluster domain-containing protein [Candidatus Altiarchaeota archaeon]|nr:4Fe-4S dicluster domain-containing protein [Candidatus Altiarchaeota archaeon]